jgi:glycerophosphoryl diester phosphodiesterase
VERRTLNIGHRGASGHAPENTIAAFRLALQLGADGVELDVRLSADLVPVVFHDADLVRLFKRKSAVPQKTAKALKAFSFGPRFGEKFAGERIPTLEEALDAVKGRIVNVELKPETALDRELVLRTVCIARGSGAVSNIIISSFNPVSIAMVRRIAPEIRTAFLFKPDGPAGLRGPLAGYALRTNFLNPFKGLVDPASVVAWHGRGFGVMTWTVNDEPEMRSMLNAGVDAIITNFPDRLAGIMDPAGHQTR